MMLVLARVLLMLVLLVLRLVLLLLLLRVLRLRLARARPPLVPGEVRRRGLDARNIDAEHVREDAVPRDLRAGARGRRRRAALELLERLALEYVRAFLLAERVVRAALRALAGAARAAAAAADPAADAVEREQPVVDLDLGALQEAPGAVRAGPYHLAGRVRASGGSARDARGLAVHAPPSLSGWPGFVKGRPRPARWTVGRSLAGPRG